MASDKTEFANENIGYPDLYLEKAVSADLTERILATPGGIRVGENISAIDLHRLDLKSEDIIPAISRHLDVPLDSVSDGSPECEKILADINEALEKAYDYIVQVLEMKSVRVKVTSKKDLQALLQQTTRYAEDAKNNIESHARHCALVSMALVMFELQKKDAHTLQAEIGYVQDLFTKLPNPNDTAERVRNPLFTPRSAGEIGNGSWVVMTGLNPECRVRLWIRNKNEQSAATKFTMKVEASAAESLKDAIGIRIEAPSDRVEEVTVRILSYIQRHFNPVDLHLENTNLLPEERFTGLCMELQEQQDIPINIVSDLNPNSASKYRVLKITGEMPVPRGGVEGAITNDRGIEVQIVDERNKNESGMSNHDVYDLSKLVTVMTRLYGGCSRAWLEKKAKVIEDAGGPSVENIIDGLVKDGKLIRLPNRRNRYGSATVYARWYKIPGFLPADVRKYIEHVIPKEKLETKKKNQEEDSF